MYRILLFILLVGLSSQINMRTYDRSGFYELNPSDYGYQDTVIIEMWSAGTGSSTTYFKNGTTLYCPGNSGSYIKFFLVTGLQTYYFTLGSGGICSITSSLSDSHIAHNYIGEDGEASIFYSYLELPIFYLEGGYASVPDSNGVYIQPGEYDYEYENTAHYNILRYHSSVQDECYYNVDPDKCGSHAPYGYECEDTNQCDGYMGSGAQYNCNTASRTPYQGGDGALVIYF